MIEEVMKDMCLKSIFQETNVINTDDVNVHDRKEEQRKALSFFRSLKK